MGGLCDACGSRGGQTHHVAAAAAQPQVARNGLQPGLVAHRKTRIFSGCAPPMKESYWYVALLLELIHVLQLVSGITKAAMRRAWLIS